MQLSGGASDQCASLAIGSAATRLSTSVESFGQVAGGAAEGEWMLR